MPTLRLTIHLIVWLSDQDIRIACREPHKDYCCCCCLLITSPAQDSSHTLVCLLVHDLSMQHPHALMSTTSVLGNRPLHSCSAPGGLHHAGTCLMGAHACDVRSKACVSWRGPPVRAGHARPLRMLQHMRTQPACPDLDSTCVLLTLIGVPFRCHPAEESALTVAPTSLSSASTCRSSLGCWRTCTHVHTIHCSAFQLPLTWPDLVCYTMCRPAKRLACADV